MSSGREAWGEASVHYIHCMSLPGCALECSARPVWVVQPKVLGERKLTLETMSEQACHWEYSRIHSISLFMDSEDSRWKWLCNTEAHCRPRCRRPVLQGGWSWHWQAWTSAIPPFAQQTRQFRPKSRWLFRVPTSMFCFFLNCCSAECCFSSMQHS